MGRSNGDAERGDDKRSVASPVIHGKSDGKVMPSHPDQLSWVRYDICGQFQRSQLSRRSEWTGWISCPDRAVNFFYAGVLPGRSDGGNGKRWRRLEMAPVLQVMIALRHHPLLQAVMSAGNSVGNFSPTGVRSGGSPAKMMNQVILPAISGYELDQTGKQRNEAAGAQRNRYRYDPAMQCQSGSSGKTSGMLFRGAPRGNGNLAELRPVSVPHAPW